MHLDGSVPPTSLLRVSQRRQLVLPGLGGRVPATVADIWTALESMGEHWQWFDLVNEIIGGDEATLEEIAEEFVDHQAANSISYTVNHAAGLKAMCFLCCVCTHSSEALTLFPRSVPSEPRSSPLW